MNIKLLFFPFSIIIFLGSFIVYTKPNWDIYNNQKNDLKKLIQEKQEIVAGVNKIKQASVKMHGLSDDSKTFVYNALPLDINEDDLVGEINKNASQAGVLVTKISTKKTKARINSSCRNATQNKLANIDCTPGASLVNINLLAVGTYPMLKDFLGKLDTQNRLINPINFTLLVAQNNNKDENTKDQTSQEIKLVTAKVDFNVFQKKKNTKIVLSKALNNDRVLKSLLTEGLRNQTIDKLNNFVTSPLFYPVKTDETGKENLFE